MKDTPQFLDTILNAKKIDLAAKKKRKCYEQLEAELQDSPPYDGAGFYETLKASEPNPKIIAEVKKASPSRGIIRDNFSLEEINRAYQASPNVAAISVLTEKDYFKGGDDVLKFIAENNTHQKPLLRKDFIFDPYQVLESKLLGAQAFLLITAMLDAETLNSLVDLGLKIGIEPLVEVHDEVELKIAKNTNARVIGVNSRDLKTFSVDQKAHELLKKLDDKYARVAESGIVSAEYLAYISEFADAALIGTEFMKSDDIESAIDSLLNKEPVK